MHSFKYISNRQANAPESVYISLLSLGALGVKLGREASFS